MVIHTLLTERQNTAELMTGGIPVTWVADQKNADDAMRVKTAYYIILT
jgi:hypothetical protein